MKSSVTSNSSIVRRKGRAGSSGEKTVETSSEQIGSNSRSSRSLITRHSPLRNIFPGCPFREVKISLICALLNPNGDKISNNKVSGADSWSKTLIRIPCSVCTFCLPSSIPFLYKRAASFRCSAVRRRLSFTEGLISCISGKRLRRILLRVYSSCRLVLSVT